MRLLLSIVLLVAQGAPAPFVQTSGDKSPVSINMCGPMVAGGTSFGGLALIGTSAGIQIQFTNQTSKVANLVNFRVDSNGNSFVIRDVGTFSPGIEITHRYRNGQGQAFVLPAFISPKIKCKVDSVHFADGTSWQRGKHKAIAATPQPLAPGESLLSVSPSRVDTTVHTGSQYFMVSTGEQLAGFAESNSCQGIANVSIVASGASAATYTVKPIGSGACVAIVKDQDGHSVTVPITVR